MQNTLLGRVRIPQMEPRIGLDTVHEDTAPPMEVLETNISEIEEIDSQNLRRKNQSQIPIIAEIPPHTPAKNTVKILASSDIAFSSAVAVDVPDAVLSSQGGHTRLKKATINLCKSTCTRQHAQVFSPTNYTCFL